MTTDSDWRNPDKTPVTRVPPLTEAAMRRIEEEERTNMPDPGRTTVVKLPLRDKFREWMDDNAIAFVLIVAIVALVSAGFAIYLGLFADNKGNGLSQDKVSTLVDERVAAERTKLGYTIVSGGTFQIDPRGPVAKYTIAAAQAAALDAKPSLTQMECLLDVIQTMKDTGVSDINPDDLCANK